MKLFSKKFLGIAFCVATLGAAASFAALSNNNKNELKVADAAGTRRFFLDCTQHSDYDNAQSVGIQYYDGSYHKIEATKAADNYWYVDVPSSNLSKVQFFRCDTGNVDKNYNWQNEGNPSNVNYYSVKGWDNNGVWSNVNGADETYEVASTTPSTSTKRIWADPKDNFYDANARAGLRVFNGGTHYKTFILGGSSQYKTVNSQMLFYVDIPSTYDCQLVRLHNVFNFVWTYGGNFSDISGYNTANVVYSWAADAGCSTGNENNPTVDYAKAVLDGYSTCLSSSVNGYGNYVNINTCVLGKLSAANLSSLRSATFTASGYGTRTYGEKIDRMSNSGNLSSAQNLIALKISGKNNGTLITVISLMAICSVGGYFFLKKKKQESIN